MMTRAVLLVLGASGLAAACVPMSPKMAADRCEERARAATGPTGEIEMGFGSSGVESSIEIGVTSDFLTGRDPYVVYDECVRDLTGQGPIRPLAL